MVVDGGGAGSEGGKGDQICCGIHYYAEWNLDLEDPVGRHVIRKLWWGFNLTVSITIP